MACRACQRVRLLIDGILTGWMTREEADERKRALRGKLTERVTIARRIETNPDAPHDYGNTVADWADEGTVAAEYIHLRGGESVMAGRLQGRHPQIVRVRASALTRQVATDWRVTDARAGTVFNVKDVTHTPDRAWCEWLVETGSAP